jgi:hypothetical protein
MSGISKCFTDGSVEVIKDEDDPEVENKLWIEGYNSGIASVVLWNDNLTVVIEGRPTEWSFYSEGSKKNIYRRIRKDEDSFYVKVDADKSLTISFDETGKGDFHFIEIENRNKWFHLIFDTENDKYTFLITSTCDGQ